MAKRKQRKQQGMETVTMRIDRETALFYREWAKRARVPPEALMGIVVEVIWKAALANWKLPLEK